MTQGECRISAKLLAISVLSWQMTTMRNQLFFIRR